MILYFIMNVKEKIPICYSKHREYLEELIKTRRRFKDYHTIAKLEINKSGYSDIKSLDGLKRVYRLKEYDNIVVMENEIEEFLEEDTINKVILYATHQLIKIDNFIKENVRNMNLSSIEILNNKILYNAAREANNEEDSFNYSGLLKIFIHEFEPINCKYDYIIENWRNNVMNDRRLKSDEEILETFASKLIEEYETLKNLSDIVIMDTNEAKIVDEGLEEFKKVIKKIKKAKSVKELNKYIKVKKILKDANMKV